MNARLLLFLGALCASIFTIAFTIPGFVREAYRWIRQPISLFSMFRFIDLPTVLAANVATSIEQPEGETP